MIEQFNKYVSNYDMSDFNINLKYNHSLRVMKLSEKYAKILGFSKKDIELAKIIGLLHDYGRFEQLKLYNSYNDHNTMDHADYSVKVLFDENEIEKYYDKKEDYEIIKFAIKNHNKYKIESTDDDRKIKFAKLIRDVDKIDIMYLSSIGSKKFNNCLDLISNSIIESIKKHEIINYDKIKNENDRIALEYALVFDINYNECLEEIMLNLKKFNEKINNKLFDEIYNEVIKYVKERKIC